MSYIESGQLKGMENDVDGLCDLYLRYFLSTNLIREFNQWCRKNAPHLIKIEDLKKEPKAM